MLRDRLVPLLYDADEAWEHHRRLWQQTPVRRAAKKSSLSSSQPRTATVTAAVAERREKNEAHRLRSGNGNGRRLPSSASRRRHYLDSGAGPRKFWETVAGPRLVDVGWNVDVKVGCICREIWLSRKVGECVWETGYSVIAMMIALRWRMFVDTVGGVMCDVLYGWGLDKRP